MPDEKFESLKRSYDLAKDGYHHAQDCIRLMDTKAGVAVGLLMFLIPTPIAVVAWATKLENEPARIILAACKESWWLMILGIVGLCVGFVLGLLSTYHGIYCISPRVPKGHGKASAFNNEFQPNVIFPMYAPEIRESATAHFQKLSNGVDWDFVVHEYERQLIEVGRILHEKSANLSECFRDLRWMLAAYAFSLAVALLLCLKLCFAFK